MHRQRNTIAFRRQSLTSMDSASKDVFLIGAGFIGGELLDRLLEEKYNVTVLVRREAAAKELESRGAKTAMGQLDDSETITKHTEANDIIFHTATADHLPSVEAVIRGIERRAAADKETIYIHTSGTSLLSDHVRGAHKSETIFSDSKPEQIDALPDSASHRLIDLAIIHARKRLGNTAKMFIMTPPLIYGANSEHQRLSIQVPTMARFAIKHKYAGHVGKGKSVWSLVHVTDLSYGYMVLLHWLQRIEANDFSLEPPYFFCESGEEISWGELAGMIGDGLKKAGVIEDAAPREIPEQDYDDLFGKYSAVVIGANSRSRADRLRELGWKPNQRPVREAFEKEELPLLLKEDLSDYHGYAAPAASGPG